MIQNDIDIDIDIDTDTDIDTDRQTDRQIERQRERDRIGQDRTGQNKIKYVHDLYIIYVYMHVNVCIYVDIASFRLTPHCTLGESTMVMDFLGAQMMHLASGKLTVCELEHGQ